MDLNSNSLYMHVSSENGIIWLVTDEICSRTIGCRKSCVEAILHRYLIQHCELSLDFFFLCSVWEYNAGDKRLKSGTP